MAGKEHYIAPVSDELEFVAQGIIALSNTNVGFGEDEYIIWESETSS